MTAQSLRQLQTYFNSRPSARGDAIGKPTFVMSVFQFTPLREGRHFLEVQRASCYYFNSRPSARGDLQMNRQMNFAEFQFTPLREGRH